MFMGMRGICTINGKAKASPQCLVQCFRFDGFRYNSQLSAICAVLEQSAEPRWCVCVTWSLRDFDVAPNPAGSTCSLGRQWHRGGVEHCSVSGNLMSSFSARCDLPVESWARGDLKKGRTLLVLRARVIRRLRGVTVASNSNVYKAW